MRPFFKELEPKANALSMAQIAVAVAGQLKQASEAVAFLQQKAKDLEADRDAHALLLTMAASNLSAGKQFAEAKALLEQVALILDGALGLDSLVYSQYYRVLAVFHKDQVHAGDFFRSGLLYLAYTPLESIQIGVQRNLARDLALAGLVAEDVYGLGELLSHGVVDSIRNDAEYSWLMELASSYNSGDIARWNSLKQSHSSQISQHNSVILSMDVIEQKIALLALVELVWSRPADGRKLSFSDIALAAHVDVNHVEMLVMRAMSLKVLRGEIDEINQFVSVQNVKSRVLAPEQILETQKRVKAWKEHVQTTLLDVEQTELAQ